MRSTKFGAVAAFAILALAACGGSSSPSVVATPTAAPTGTLSTPASTATSTPPATSASPTPVPTLASATPISTDRGTGACRLLSAAEINAVTGGSYGEGVADAVGGCNWTGGAAYIYADGFDHPLADAKSAYPGGVDLTVSGHACYFATPGSALQAIWVELPAGVLAISFTPFPDAVAQGFAEQLAAIAIAHI
ncbi:MAG: hypothetical protein ABIZ34_00745 [Candidatus Limnocylindrales bacterium]